MPDPIPPFPGLPSNTPPPSPEPGLTFLNDLGMACSDPDASGPVSSASGIRLFSIWEICRYILPVAVGHLRRVLRENPHLPQGETNSDGRAKRFTLNEIDVLRHWFAANGKQRKPYRPYRPANAPARTVTFAQMLQGAGKTTICAHLAMAAALEGYRVLLIDLDGQGDLSHRFLAPADTDALTAQTLLARHCADHLQAANRNRLTRGDQPLSMPEMLTDARRIDPAELIRSTRWPGIDIIPAGPGLCAVDAVMAEWESVARGWPSWEALRVALGERTLANGYDLIFVDTPSTLGPLALAGITAADILLVPTTATSIGTTMTGRFLGLLQTLLRDIENRQNIAARALGEAETRFSWKAIRLVINRYDDARQAQAGAALSARLGPVLMPHKLSETALAATKPRAGIYEVDYREVGREAWVRARSDFDAVYADFKQILIDLWDEERLPENSAL